MEYEWNEEKHQANIAKHKVYFEDAIEVFDDPNELTEPARTVSGEERLQTIGAVPFLATLLVVHTLRETIQGEVVTRIISARPASRKERQRYEQRER
ncbi:BrnT family toxin [Devosia ginsengisoli]|uniref:BrnT family toxin n=1 Tax=Devosia ginsengisoli TaxID=400770 RepID=A0A5B8LXF8_9HYPH|nr:BrnT family toxin [Devosia ginsengisoli]QDZ12364.1 BrnT family toxin [Devosia ginsengisoli]